MEFIQKKTADPSIEYSCPKPPERNLSSMDAMKGSFLSAVSVRPAEL